MSEYTSLMGLVGDQPELESLLALESTVDSVRFRFDNIPNDVTQRRPPGASRSMSEIMARMCTDEERFVEQLRWIVAEEPLSRAVGEQHSPFARETNSLEDMAHFLQLREEALAILRRLSESEWGKSAELPRRGRISVAELTRRRAQETDHDLRELTLVRQLLDGRDQLPGAQSLPGLPGATWE